MTIGHPYCALIITTYIFFAVKKLEESDFVREMGDKYRNYMSQVRGFLPLSKYREPATQRNPNPADPKQGEPSC